MGLSSGIWSKKDRKMTLSSMRNRRIQKVLFTGICRIQKEADTFLESLGYKHDLEKNCYEELFESNKKVALFAHQGFGMAFLSCILDIPYPYYSTHFDITTTGVTVIDFSKWREPVIPAVMTHSDVSHLYGEHIPLRYNSRGHI